MTNFLTQRGDSVSTQTAQQGPQYILSQRFYVEMEQQLTAWFTGCQGLSVKNDTKIIKEGGVNYQQRVLLGRASFTEVTLSRGMTNSLTFWDWMASSYEGGSNIRRSVNILTFNQAGETMQCWTLIGAVPTAWKAPALKATSTDVAIEELTLAFEGLKVVRERKSGGRATYHKQRDSKGFWDS